MEVGAGISPKLLLARLSFQSPLKFGLASAGNTASVMTAKAANKRLGDIQQLLFSGARSLRLLPRVPGYYRNRRRAQNGPRRAKRQAICFRSEEHTSEL